MIRSAAPSDRETLLAIAVDTGLFAPPEADELLGGVLTAHHAGVLGSGHVVVVWEPTPTSAPVGWTYFAQDAHAPGIWNLWWIGVRPTHHGQGIGAALLRFVEQAVVGAGGRVLIIETSALPALAATRAFYATRGYVECGRVPDYYAPGDVKVIFAKRLEVAAVATDA